MCQVVLNTPWRRSSATACCAEAGWRSSVCCAATPSCVVATTRWRKSVLCMVKRRLREIATVTVTNFARLSKSSTRTRHGAPAPACLRSHLLGDHRFSAAAEEVRSAAHSHAAAHPAAGSTRSSKSDAYCFDSIGPLWSYSPGSDRIRDRHRQRPLPHHLYQPWCTGEVLDSEKV